MEISDTLGASDDGAQFSTVESSQKSKYSV
jgi:hypothetical protein